jgi:hypothetical protein
VPAASWTRSNGTAMSRDFNLDGQLTSHSFGSGTRMLTYDPKGRIDSISEPGRAGPSAWATTVWIG